VSNFRGPDIPTWWSIAVAAPAMGCTAWSAFSIWLAASEGRLLALVGFVVLLLVSLALLLLALLLFAFADDKKGKH
jgi:hypothetical protein